MLNIVIGRSGSGKTEELIRNMQCCERSVYIVPEQYSFAAEKKITQAFGMSGLGRCEVYSLRRLAYKLNESFGSGKKESIDKSGRIMVLSDIVRKCADSLTLFGGAARRGEMAEEAAVIVTTLKQYDITKEKLDFAISKTQNMLLKKKLCDCRIISQAYEEFLKEGYSDSEDLLEDLRQNISKSEKLKESDIFIDSFTAFTPLEMKVIAELLINSRSVTVSLCIGEGGDEFITARKTMDALKRLCKEYNVPFGRVIEKKGAMYTAAEEIKMLEKSFFEAAEYNEKTDRIKLFKGKNEYDEALWAARFVEELCREKGYRYRDIAIVARDMALYEKEFTRVFDRFRIPLFMDKKTPLSAESAAVFMLGAIRIVSGGWRNESVFSYMKTAFSPLDENECDELENYCLASGVRRSDWKRADDWDMCPGVLEESTDREYLKRIDNIRRRLVAPIIKLEEKIKGRKTGHEFAVAFYEFLQECELGEKIERISKKLENGPNAFLGERMKQVYSLVIDVLESFERAFCEKKLTAEEFVSILTAGIDSVEIGIIPNTADSVCAGSIDRVRGHGAKCVIIVGAAEGRFPSSPKDTGIFTNADRQELKEYSIELPPDSLGKAFMEESLVYGALTCANERLGVSYCTSAENPTESVIVKRIRAVFKKVETEENIEGVTSDYSSYESFGVEYAKMCRGEEVDEDWYTALEYYKKHDAWRDKISEIEKYTLYENKTEFIREELIRARYGNEIKTSVSRLEQYSKCPFAYFAAVTLGLKERKELEVTAADSGSFLHEFVDRFGKCLFEEGKRWQDVEKEYIDKKTEEITLELLGGINRHLIENSPRIRHLFAQLKRIAKRSVTVLSEHMKKGVFEPLGYEIVFDEKGQFKPLKIDLPNGQSVKLRGRVDRADILNTDRGKFVRIIDYKSGNKKFSVPNIYHGFDLQLAVYLTALCEGGNMRPAGMLYFKIDDPVIDGDISWDEKSIESKVRGELKMDGLLLEDDEILKAMDSSYETGSDVIPVKKKKDGSFSASSKVASEGEFGALSKHVKKTVRKLADEILSGNSSINPVRGACEWCEMKSLCGFDTSLKGCSYRYVEKINDRDALLKVIEENKQ